MLNLFGHSIRYELVLLYMVEAFAAFGAVYLFLALGAAQGEPVEHAGFTALAVVLAVSSGPVSGAVGFYQPELWSQARRVLTGILVGSLLLLMLSMLAIKVLGPVLPPSMDWGLAKVLIASATAIALTRLGFAGASQAGLFTRRIAVLRGPRGRAVTELTLGMNEALGPFKVALAVPANGRVVDELAPERLRSENIWALVVGDAVDLPEPVRLGCAKVGVRVFADSSFCERCFGRVDLDALPDNWLNAVGGVRENKVESAVRRGFDIAVALALLLLTLPVLLLTASVIKFDSPGPIFYRQERVGRGGRVFTLFKFRSMVIDAEAGGAPRWATQNDPRTTRVGRLIRLTRIDEIPQVLNVLRGDMAFVGPRPERPAFVKELGLVVPHYQDRACVKPGITGWAQINYPYGASVEDARGKLAYDLYYVRRRSLFLDLLILVATVRVVVFQEGSR